MAIEETTGLPPPPYELLRLPMVLLYSCVFLVGLPANLLTFWFSLGQVRRKNVLGVYLCSLSLCDLTYLGTLPLWAMYMAQDHQWSWGSTACKVTGFVFFSNMYISILLLCCISCDRYVAVTYALESRGLRCRRVALVVAVAIVAAVTLAHVPVFLMREGVTEHGDANMTGGDGKCFEPAHTSTPAVTAMSYARFVVGFVVPLVLLAASNRGILRVVRDSHSLEPCRKTRVRRLAVAVVMLFLVCFAPYHLVLLVRTASYQILGDDEAAAHAFWRGIFTPYTVSLGFSTLNSACNPILYVLCSEDARKELSLALRGQGGVTGHRPDTTRYFTAASQTPVGI